jgi:hypothetical protein
MPEHLTRDQRVLYDHEYDAGQRRRQADDWGIDESFPRVRGHRFARARPAPPSADQGPLLVEADERRTIRINGRPDELSEIAPFVSSAARHRPPPTVSERLAGDPTRIIAMAFALGLLLILIAVATADAAPLM